MDRKRPQKGDVYIHFKGKQYQIICIAMHTETEEELVVYQALYGNRGIYARPLDMFLSPVDLEKYPEARQKYRFELVKEEKKDITEASGPHLLPVFLELDRNEERIEFLQRNKRKLNDTFLTAAAESLEYVEKKGTLEERYQDMLKFLKTKIKYERSRLR
ncbi:MULTISPECIES: DUF1653 domain-containing protein [Lachnospiraceae]|jgi:hypothetical protein|uniref:DUF1653 domain-containing protein n=1 Tax=Faecalicatena acetigenes TaxID=2981790 RepID=A0ABT2TBA6_9FIRM|nr:MULTISPECIES: DUF1653 domain-containing protein [Lachnospiraceae]MCU6747568.1 DUF1653 domain-containing protein [Faecalicatena acetigenes]RGT70442.1 DUF1653 domain-containing protein [Ruminococcus sp. AF18-22]SCH97205.1 Uncharacterized protein conserved in bacteria [uncultured Clostridium sp.]